MDPAELERLASRAFDRLPEPRAPRTFLARVMAAVALEARRPWYRRAWRTWPAAWQATSAAALIILAAGGVLLVPGVFANVREALAMVSMPVPSPLDGPVRTLAAVWDAAAVVWRLVVQPVAPYLALFVLVMSMACVAFGTALDRVVALGGATKS
jgi:hypothetical protein